MTGQLAPPFCVVLSPEEFVTADLVPPAGTHGTHAAADLGGRKHFRPPACNSSEILVRDLDKTCRIGRQRSTLLGPEIVAVGRIFPGLNDVVIGQLFSPFS